MKKFIIQAIDTLEPLYWSNDWGWTDLNEATVFEDHERETCALPVGGQWVEISEGQMREIRS